jgi:hypothetical protein
MTLVPTAESGPRSSLTPAPPPLLHPRPVTTPRPRHANVHHPDPAADRATGHRSPSRRRQFRVVRRHSQTEPNPTAPRSTCAVLKHRQEGRCDFVPGGPHATAARRPRSSRCCSTTARPGATNHISPRSWPGPPGAALRAFRSADRCAPRHDRKGRTRSVVQGAAGSHDLSAAGHRPQAAPAQDPEPPDPCQGRQEPARAAAAPGTSTTGCPPLDRAAVLAEFADDGVTFGRRSPSSPSSRCCSSTTPSRQERKPP